MMNSISLRLQCKSLCIEFSVSKSPGVQGPHRLFTSHLESKQMKLYPPSPLLEPSTLMLSTWCRLFSILVSLDTHVSKVKLFKLLATQFTTAKFLYFLPMLRLQFRALYETFCDIKI
uniref:(northern house mosquito) hypothetical protein n=1 Tax=Culex pipiens TaxID=7175 RepID=A0A8D8HPI0_CULPI